MDHLASRRVSAVYGLMYPFTRTLFTERLKVRQVCLFVVSLFCFVLFCLIFSFCKLHIVKTLLLDSLDTFKLFLILPVHWLYCLYVLYYALPRLGNKRINQSIKPKKQIKQFCFYKIKKIKK